MLEEGMILSNLKWVEYGSFLRENRKFRPVGREEDQTHERSGKIGPATDMGRWRETCGGTKRLTPACETAP